MANKPAVNSGKCRYMIGAIGSNDYCNKPTKYTVREDEDGNKIRKYNVFCNHHRGIIAAMEEDESEF